MLPLAATSTTAAIKRLGGRNWQRLHRLAYAIGVCAVLHYLWLAKKANPDPVLLRGDLGGTAGDPRLGVGAPPRGALQGWRARCSVERARRLTLARP